MKKLFAIAGIVCLSQAAIWGADLAPANEAGVAMGHLHLNVMDVQAEKKLWLTLGGTPAKQLSANANRQVVKFPGVLIAIGKQKDPPAGGSAGSVVDHVGFKVPDVQASIAKWKAAGVTVEPGGNGRMDQAFVTTPDGLRIEILEDKNQTIPIRHHHIHYYVPESEIPKIQAWYAKEFGAKPGMRGTNVADDIPGANFSFSKATGPTVSTKGHTLDHIGFDVKNLEAFVKKLQADGVKVDRPYTKNAQTGAALAFIYDPWGTYIELNERPNPL